MKILSGLFDHMVLQRTAANISDTPFHGESPASGPILARITKDGKPLPAFDWIRVGQAAEGKISGRITGLPTGGLYTIELRVDDKSKSPDAITISDILVGDVWIIAGQSNMQGCGRIEHAAKPHPMVRGFYSDDRWAVAQDPIHNLWDCVDQVHIDYCGGVRCEKNTTHGCGPAVAFGQELFRLTNVPQGLIACAHGGTSMQQWDPAMRDKGGSSLYGASIRRLRRNGGRVAGVVWYQGEGDTTVDDSPKYTQRMQNLINAFRSDAGDSALPFVLVQLSRYVADETTLAQWNSIREQQRLLPKTVKACAVVPAIDLPMDDGIHIGGPGVNRLGKRLGQAMASLRDGKTKPPIELKSVVVDTDPVTKIPRAIVEFDNVESALQSGNSRPVGFSLTDGKLIPGVFDVQLQGNRVIAYLTVPIANFEKFSLYYGYGMDPICNITDAGDRSLPTFGPIPLVKHA